MQEHSSNQAIELNNLEFSYSKKRAQNTILSIPSWQVAQQEQLFIHGASGDGKSTLLNILSGLLSANSGQVSVLGHQLHNMSNHQRDRFRANHIGYVSQQFNLIPYLSAIDNIKLANHFSNSTAPASNEVFELLKMLNIPVSDAKKPAQNMSIGQQQRIAIARALINKPELLIADEPTSALDSQNRDGFMALLKEIATEHKTTLVFVSHDLALAQYFTRVEALSDINQAGKISNAS